MAAKPYVSPKLSVANLGAFDRADIIFHDVDHSGASYEGRVFLNNPGADESTPQTDAEGFAGAFHIFGHGGCYGDVGHCDVKERSLYDPRPGHPLTGAKKVVIATAAIRRAQSQGTEVTVTVVPVVTSTTDRAKGDDVLKFQRLSIASYHHS